MSRSHIANTIRLLQLPLESQQLLTDGKIQAGHARALLSLGDAEAVNALALRVAAEDLSVRETEELVRRYVGRTSEEGRAAGRLQPTATAPSRSGMAEVEEILSEQLATRVQIQMNKKRGRVIIEFGSADDLERIVSEIVGSGPGLSPPTEPQTRSTAADRRMTVTQVGQRHAGRVAPIGSRLVSVMPGHTLTSSTQGRRRASTMASTRVTSRRPSAPAARSAPSRTPRRPPSSSLAGAKYSVAPAVYRAA